MANKRSKSKRAVSKNGSMIKAYFPNLINNKDTTQFAPSQNKQAQGAPPLYMKSA